MIISVVDVTSNISLGDSNSIIDVVIRTKFDDYSISITCAYLVDFIRIGMKKIDFSMVGFG